MEEQRKADDDTQADDRRASERRAQMQRRVSLQVPLIAVNFSGVTEEY
jgi:hypothetical protein